MNVELTQLIAPVDSIFSPLRVYSGRVDSQSLTRAISRNATSGAAPTLAQSKACLRGLRRFPQDSQKLGGREWAGPDELAREYPSPYHRDCGSGLLSTMMTD